MLPKSNMLHRSTPGGTAQALPAMHNCRRAAFEDAASIESSGTAAQIDLNFVGEGQFYVVVSVD